MAVYILHYREANGQRAPLLNKYVQLFGMRGITIDSSGQGAKRAELRFTSVQAALDAPQLQGLQWVWLHPEVETCLDKYEHPADDVVYCVGDDQDGFDGLDPRKLPGCCVCVRDWPETFAACVVPLVAYDRHLFLHGRRK